MHMCRIIDEARSPLLQRVEDGPRVRPKMIFIVSFLVDLGAVKAVLLQRCLLAVSHRLIIRRR